MVQSNGIQGVGWGPLGVVSLDPFRGVHKGKTIFIEILRYDLPFYFHYLKSVQWCLPEAA